MGKKIIWTRFALEQLNDIHDYLFNVSKSLQVADKVVYQIYSSASILINQSLLHPLDVYKLHNDGSYHAYETYRYRISYKVSTDEVYILSVKHSSRKPTKY